MWTYEHRKRPHLEAAKGIVRFSQKVFVESSAAMRLVGAGAPLAVAASSARTVSRKAGGPRWGFLSKRVVDEGFHANSAHGIEEMLSG